MRVLKIIQANPDVFNVDQNTIYTEIDAVRIIAAMECKGNAIQIEEFEIRQAHTAICNLFSLGYRSSAVELAIELLPKAESYQHYKIAQDLCDRLITHFYLNGTPKSVKLYKTLYDKFTSVLSYEHEFTLLYGTTISNYKQNLPIDKEELMHLLDVIKKKLPLDSFWYHYYYYQCKILVCNDDALEQTYLDAIAYFENLYFNHTSTTRIFREELINYYFESNELEKAEKHLAFLDSGSMNWFTYQLSLVNLLLEQQDIMSNDICNLVMNNANFKTLPNELKEKWKIAYKASVKLFLSF